MKAIAVFSVNQRIPNLETRGIEVGKFLNRFLTEFKTSMMINHAYSKQNFIVEFIDWSS